MSNKKRLLAGILLFLIGCAAKPKQKALTADFRLGQVKCIHISKAVATGEELTLMTRFELNNKGIGGELNNYFQYQLGKKIQLVINGDTLKPLLFYYIPLINDQEKEIDSKFLISDSTKDKPKQIIITDTILDFNKVNISFK